MRARDIFGVRSFLGQVKECPIFKTAEPVPGTVSTPGATPATTTPEPTAVVPEAPSTLKGVTLTANIANEKGESPRGILLSEGLDPVFLMATAFGIFADAPADALGPDGVSDISIPMMMFEKDPAVIKSSLAAVRPTYSQKIWFFKIDKSPITFSIPASEMSENGKNFAAIAFRFPAVGSFYITPSAVVLKDGEDQSMNFTVRTTGVMGVRYPVRNIR